jgi:hypothetical protein
LRIADYARGPFELLLAITLSVLLRPPAPGAARLTQIMVPTGATCDN